MSNYRRWYVPGGTYFFTVVTHFRRPILTTESGRRILRQAIDDTITAMPFNLVAIVLLPDPLHCVWTLPHGHVDYSTRWGKIKEAFTVKWRRAGGREAPLSASRVKHRERGVWQRRFWEHRVRDEDDLIRCVDYIHWNPVKHGYAQRVKDYPWSSFHRFVESGDYDLDWGAGASVEVPGAEWE